MVEKFKPTIGEILKETGKNLGKGIGYTAAGIVGIPVAICGGLVYCVGMTHILPTSFKVHGGGDSDLACAVPILGAIGGLFGYGIAISHTDHFELLAIPVVTNVASGVYELYRYSKEKIIQRHEREEYDKILKRDLKRQRESELEKGVEETSKLDSKLEEDVNEE